jgi:glutathione S-transferase
VHRLITIRFSHYNEKARWALDRYRVPYREERYMPTFHFLPTMALALRHGLGRKDVASTPFSTPALVTDDGDCLRDSSEIVRWVSDRHAGGALYPTDEVAALERRFHDELGPHARRVAYFHAFGDPSLLGKMADHNVGRAQAALFKVFQPVAELGIKKSLRVTAEGAERSTDKVRALFDEIGLRVRGRRYLVGDTFTAADLAFACMAAPALLPSQAEGYAAWFPPIDEVPRAIGDLVRELRASEAGVYALRMFAEERRAL